MDHVYSPNGETRSAKADDVTLQAGSDSLLEIMASEPVDREDVPVSCVLVYPFVGNLRDQGRIIVEPGLLNQNAIPTTGMATKLSPK